MPQTLVIDNGLIDTHLWILHLVDTLTSHMGSHVF